MKAIEDAGPGWGPTPEPTGTPQLRAAANIPPTTENPES